MTSWRFKQTKKKQRKEKEDSQYKLITTSIIRIGSFGRKTVRNAWKERKKVKVFTR